MMTLLLTQCFVRLLAQWRFRRGVEKQMQVLMKGVHEFVPSHLLRLFDERELEVSQVTASHLFLQCHQFVFI
jgi:hypothetical protein